jgi:hypothetical protein
MKQDQTAMEIERTLLPHNLLIHECSLLGQKSSAVDSQGRRHGQSVAPIDYASGLVDAVSAKA